MKSYIYKLGNNVKILLLLFFFTLFLLGVSYVFVLAYNSNASSQKNKTEYYNDPILDKDFYNYYSAHENSATKQSYKTAKVNKIYKALLPYILLAIIAWFVIAYFFHTVIIEKTTRSHPLCKEEFDRVYVITRRLCKRYDLPMPKMNVIYDRSFHLWMKELRLWKNLLLSKKISLFGRTDFSQMTIS
ncbi:hypothetical protein [Dysgonomonas sp. 520]|uniref:hypothetical protein n=1 Tax=Dysgonomonas sp. 520 TaxID=2302931 RepID=UPI0013CF4E45|nr:hypothetical protein [Dysgonomonas sp. 520]